MTIKIKLTQKQADFIVKGLDSGLDKEEMLNKFANTKVLRGSTHHSLHGLCVMDLARALLIGYEIEPEPLKVGDWAITESGRTGKVNRIEGNAVWACWGDDDEERWNPLEMIRKMTPEEIKVEKERQKWAGIEPGDVLRFLPMAHEMGIYQGDADDGYVVVENSVGRYQWPKVQVELYAKKVGASNA